MAGIPGKGGKKGRSGRKPKFDEEELTAILNAAWPKKARIEAFGKVAERARRGDLEALKFLSAYGYGKPRERHEITGKDGKDLVPVLNITLEPAISPPTAEADGSASDPGD